MLQGALGFLTFAAIAWAVSENRRAVDFKAVAAGLAAQLVMGLVLMRVPGMAGIFAVLDKLVVALQKATLAGTGFVFGYVGGGPAPFVAAHPESSLVLAFQSLPLILVIGALSALFFYWRILPRIVQGFAFALRRTLGVGGALGVVVSSNVFLGMIESSLLIRPYFTQLTRSELFVLMTCGMSMIAGTVMVVYATFLDGIVANPLGQLLTASLISAPAAITIGRIMVPETEKATAGDVNPPDEYRSAMDAIAKGTQDGLHLLLAIVPMLIVLVALVALVNQGLGFLPAWDGAPITLQRLAGFAMAPVAWLMGVPWSDAQVAGGLLGTKLVLNEFVAYVDLSKLPADALAPKSRIVMTFALCSFANFGSLGILIGGVATLAPQRRAEVASLGPRAILAGTIASSMTGAVAGMLAG